MPEKHLRFEMAMAAAVHHRFLHLPPHHAAHQVGIGTPSGIHIADLQTKQTVYPGQIGLGTHQFGSGLRRRLFAVEQQ